MNNYETVQEPTRKSRNIALGITLASAAVFAGCTTTENYQCRQQGRDTICARPASSGGGGGAYIYRGGSYTPYYGGYSAPAGQTSARTFTMPRVVRSGFGGIGRGFGGGST
jgi:hypothetical protein